MNPPQVNPGPSGALNSPKQPAANQITFPDGHQARLVGTPARADGMAFLKDLGLVIIPDASPREKPADQTSDFKPINTVILIFGGTEGFTLSCN